MTTHRYSDLQIFRAYLQAALALQTGEARVLFSLQSLAVA